MIRQSFYRSWAILLGFVWLPLPMAPSRAADSAPATDSEAVKLFEKHVRPTLVAECIRCHGEKKQRGGLRLDSREGWMVGGDSGPAIVPGAPNESLLITAIRYQSTELEMPPKGILPKETIAAMERWVKLGASDPRSSEPTSAPKQMSPTIEEGKSFWSFQPVRRPVVPRVADDSWPRTDIDHFIQARLEAANLSPVPDADPASLLRRLSFDLTGMPPTPEQVETFAADPSVDAYNQLVDQFLMSPQFGERWGRHWLDVVRFAQSSGGGRTLLFPDAWRYRDYVIDAFNHDVPYDQFLREQIAGDLLPASDWQDRSRKLTATAFLLLGPTNYEMQDKDILEMDVVDEQIDTIGKAMLGMTIGCARCHDHKFDPIPTQDYYAMAGIFKSTKAMIHSNVSQWNTVELPVSPDQEKVLADYQRRIKAAKQELTKATKDWQAAGGSTKQDKLVGTKSIDPESLPGIVIDDSQAERFGDWVESTSVRGFVGTHYIHDGTAGKGEKRVIFPLSLPEAGLYEVRIAYTSGSNRSTRVPIHIVHDAGESVVKVNQKIPPKIDGQLTSLGKFRFDPENDPKIIVSNEGTEDGVVIADAFVFLRDGVSAKKRVPTGSKLALTVRADEQKRVRAERKKKETIARLKGIVDQRKLELDRLQKETPNRPTAMSTGDDDDAGDITMAIRGVVHNKGPVTPRGVMRVASSSPFPEIAEGESGRREFADWMSDPTHPLTSRVIVNRVWYWLIGNGIVSSVDNFGSVGDPPSHPELLDHLATTFCDNGWSIKTLIRQIVTSRVYKLSTDSDNIAGETDPNNRLLWRMNRKRLHAEDIRDTLLFVSGDLDPSQGGANIKEGTKSEYGYQFQSERRSVYVPVFRNALPELFEVFDFADPNLQSGRRSDSTIASQALLMMNHPFVIERSEASAQRLLAIEGLDVDSRLRFAYRQVLGRLPSENETTIAMNFLGTDGDTKQRRARWAMLYQSLFQCVDFRYLN